MRIIINKYHKKEPVKPVDDKEILVECEKCDLEFTVTEDDVSYGHFGCPKVICPCCGEETYIDADDLGLTLTSENVTYPDHYYMFGGPDTYKVSDNDVNAWVRELIHRMEADDSLDWLTRACGDTHVAVYRVDGDEEFNVIVSKRYAETYVPFKKTSKEENMWTF